MSNGKSGADARRLSGGALIGAINGLLGGGGGMLAVPILRAGGLSGRKAHATAISVILPASLVSGVVYLICGFVPAAVLIPVLLGVSAGGYFGARLLNLLPMRAVAFLFALLMFAAGWRMLL